MPWLIFQPPKMKKKIQNKTKHVQKYDLCFLKPLKSVDNVDTNDWKIKKWQKSQHTKKLMPKTKIGCLM